MPAAPPPTRAQPDAPVGLLLVLLVAVVGVVVWISDVDLGGPPPAPVGAPETTDAPVTLPPPGQPAAAGTATLPTSSDPSTGGGTVPATPPPVEDPTTLAEPGAVEDAAPAPTAVRIPALGVAAPTIELGLHDDGRLQVPRDASVTGWWTGGSRPGEQGPAVVVGHVDSRTGPGVFHDLRRLSPGDRVLIDRADGSTVHFVVQQLERHRKDRFPTTRVYGDTENATLRLITCGGAFDRSRSSYEDNVVVYLGLLGWS